MTSAPSIPHEFPPLLCIVILLRQIETVLQKEVEVAKHHLRVGDQGRALLALKKKKYQEHLLRQTDQQLLNLEQLVTVPVLAMLCSTSEPDISWDTTLRPHKLNIPSSNKMSSKDCNKEIRFWNKYTRKCRWTLYRS